MRPPLNDQLSVEDFRAYYWLKEELSAFCKTKGIDRSGGKIEMAERIADFLQSGNMVRSVDKPKKKTVSKFDWNKEELALETVITDNYKNTENVRAFFRKHIGRHFHFNVAFMKWTKENNGQTLAKAVEEWQRGYELKKDKNQQTIIEPQFEYNRYMRAFLADNPDQSSAAATRYWKLKSALRGTNEYEKSDLDLG